MTLTRMVRPGRTAAAMVLLALAVNLGCTPQTSVTKGTAPTGGSAVPAAIAGPGSATTTTPPAGPNAEALAREFLGKVNDGTATAALLTSAFKKSVTEPLFEEDKAIGYSDYDALQRLVTLKGKLAGVSLTAGPVDAESALFTGTTPTAKVLLRVVRTGTNWQTDWLFVGSLDPVGVSLPSGDAGRMAFAAASFLAAVSAKDDPLAEAVMSLPLKARLAPPFPSDKPRGFNRAWLEGKLTELRGSSAGFQILAADAGSVRAELVSGMARKTVILRVSKGERPWEWLVDDFEVK